MALQPRVGGSFAPPLSDELLATYRGMIDALPADSQVRDIMGKLHDCCAAWWEQPESSGDGARPHPVGVGTIVPLDAPIAKALWDVIPWDEELAAWAGVLDKIDPLAERELRNAAFHLLWHAKELARDREPMTKDKL